MSLFDASAIINLCREKKFDKLLQGWTLNLAFYEIETLFGNKFMYIKDKL